MKLEKTIAKTGRKRAWYDFCFGDIAENETELRKICSKLIWELASLGSTCDIFLSRKNKNVAYCESISEFEDVLAKIPESDYDDIQASVAIDGNPILAKCNVYSDITLSLRGEENIQTRKTAEYMRLKLIELLHQDENTSILPFEEVSEARVRTEWDSEKCRWDCIETGESQYYDSDGKFQSSILEALPSKEEKICILKKTYEGNTHDENWQNHIYVLDETPWHDEFEKICKKGRGWFFDPPRIEFFSDISECEEDWAKYDCDRDSWEVYTCMAEGGKMIRRVYSFHRGYEDDKYSYSYIPQVMAKKRVHWRAKLTSEKSIEMEK